MKRARRGYDTVDEPAPIRTVQLTSKRLKAHYVLGVVLTIGGAIAAVAGMEDVADSAPPSARTSTGALVGAAVCAIGLVLTAITRVRIWWHHS